MILPAFWLLFRILIQNGIYTFVTRLGIKKEDLPKYEEELELKIAKAQLEELKKEAVEAMETQRKRYDTAF